MELGTLRGQVWSINKDFQKYSEDKLKKYNITLVSLRYLITIKTMAGLNLQDMASLLDVDKALVTRTVKKLVDLGFVDKIQDSVNNKSYSLYLTDTGNEVLNSVNFMIKDWFYHVTMDFTEEERDLYVSFIERMYLNRIYKD